jgi:hypothetical protein
VSYEKKNAWNQEKISYQILAPGGSMGPRYVLQLLFSEKVTKLLITQLEKKVSTDLESFVF